MKSWAVKAREVSGLSPEDCASAMRCSKNTYLSRENTPGKLDIDELRALRKAYSMEGRSILWKALEDLRP